MEECALLADADFGALLGQTPTDPVPEAETNKTACYYNFRSGQTVSVVIITGQPGRQAYDSVMQYLDTAQGVEPVSLGDIAVIKESDGVVTLYAIINGWYLTMTGRGFDRQAIIGLAQLFEGRLIAYPQPAAEPTATPADQSTPTPGAGQCQNPYYPVVQGASWQYRLSGASNDTFTRAIIAVRADGFDDRDTFGAGTIRTGNWACRDGNLIALTPSSGGPSVSAAGAQFDFTVESNEGITFPADPQPGQTWTQNIVYSGEQTLDDLTIRSRNVLANSCKAGNTETVRVPAGEFSALRVDCSVTLDIYISGNLAFSFNSSDSAWYAPGVGWVKSVGSGNMGATEIVLLSFSIP